MRNWRENVSIQTCGGRKEVALKTPAWFEKPHLWFEKTHHDDPGKSLPLYPFSHQLNSLARFLCLGIKLAHEMVSRVVVPIHSCSLDILKSIIIKTQGGVK